MSFDPAPLLERYPNDLVIEAMIEHIRTLEHLSILISPYIGDLQLMGVTSCEITHRLNEPSRVSLELVCRPFRP